MKVFAIVLTLLFSFSGWAEYDTRYLKVTITSTNPDFPNALKVSDGYFEFINHQNYSELSVENWKGYFNSWNSENRLILYSNLIHYAPFFNGDTVDFGYVVRDTFSIPINLIQKVEVHESYRQSLLSQVYTNLDPYDDYWIHQPVIEYRSYLVPTPMCEECDYDLLDAGYMIFVHDTSSTVSSLLEKLDVLEEIRVERDQMGVDYGREYRQQEQRRLYEFYSGYSQMFDILIDLFEDEPVVIVHDSGW